jgi:hypothetical protein
MNGWELDELHNVFINSPANNEGLFYDSADSLWKNETIASALGYTPVTNARTISTSAPLSGGGDLTANRTLSITQASTSTDGFLSSTNWNTFNNKFTLPALTSGSVLFSNGTTIAQDNANLFFNSANGRLAIGTNNTGFDRLQVNGGICFGTSNNAAINNGVGAGNHTYLQFSTLGVNVMRISASANVLIGTTTDAGFKLDVNGTARVSDTTIFSKKNTTTTSSSVIVGDDVGFVTSANEPKLQIGSTNSRCNLLLGQSSNRGLLFNWSYNANASLAYGVLETYGGSNPLFIQTVGGNVGIGTTTNVSSAILHISSTTRGFLPPRMTNAQRLAIATPAVGLMVYCTDAVEGLYVNKSTGWTFVI